MGRETKRESNARLILVALCRACQRGGHEPPAAPFEFKRKYAAGTNRVPKIRMGVNESEKPAGASPSSRPEKQRRLNDSARVASQVRKGGLPPPALSLLI